MTRPYGPDDSHRVIRTDVDDTTPRVNVATDDSVAAIALYTKHEDEWIRSDTTVADMGIPQQ